MVVRSLPVVAVALALTWSARQSVADPDRDPVADRERAADRDDGADRGGRGRPGRSSPDRGRAPSRLRGARRTSHVIIISADGLRPDVIGPHTTPRLDELIREGAVARRARTILESDTLPSHAAMLSGFGAADHGLVWNRYREERGHIRVPTIFSAAKKAGLSTAMIVGKPKLRHIATPGSVDHFERPSYFCGGVSRRAAAYFTAEQPNLLFVHFSNPDEYGHSHGWMSREYKRAVKETDRCLARFLDAVDASPLGARTLVIVTADHGGHEKHHSGRPHVEVNRAIPWIVRGPGIRPGSVVPHPVGTVDTAATVLDALSLKPPPGMVGTSRLTFH